MSDKSLSDSSVEKNVPESEPIVYPISTDPPITPENETFLTVGQVLSESRSLPSMPGRLVPLGVFTSSSMEVTSPSPSNPPNTPIEPLPSFVLLDTPSTDTSGHSLQHAASSSVSNADVSSNTALPGNSPENQSPFAASSSGYTSKSLEGFGTLSIDSSDTSTSGSLSFGSSSYLAGSSAGSDEIGDRFSKPKEIIKDPQTILQERRELKKSLSQPRRNSRDRESPGRLSLSPEDRRSSDPGARKSPKRSIRSPSFGSSEKRDSTQMNTTDIFRRPFPPGFSNSTESDSLGRQATLDDVSEISMDSISDTSDRRSQTRSPTPSDSGSSGGRGRRRSSLIDDLDIIYEGAEEHRSPDAEPVSDSRVGENPEFLIASQSKSLDSLHTQQSDAPNRKVAGSSNIHQMTVPACVSSAKYSKLPRSHLQIQHSVDNQDTLQGIECSPAPVPDIKVLEVSSEAQYLHESVVDSHSIPDIEVLEVSSEAQSPHDSVVESHSPSPVLSEISEQIISSSSDRIGNGISVSESLSCGESVYANLQQWMDVGNKGPSTIQPDDAVPGPSGIAQGLMVKERTPESDISPLSDYQPSDDGSDLGTEYLQNILAKSEAAKGQQHHVLLESPSGQDQPTFMESPQSPICMKTLSLFQPELQLQNVPVESSGEAGTRHQCHHLPETQVQSITGGQSLPTFLRPFFQELTCDRNVVDSQEIRLLVFSHMTRRLLEFQKRKIPKNKNLRIIGGSQRVAHSRIKSAP